MNYIERTITPAILKLLKNFPVVAIIGPRQCGKSTLAKYITGEIDGNLYLDMEDPDDLARLENPTLFFGQYTDKLICLDEIQRKPEIFQVLRSIVDKNSRNGQFLILGSASPDLLRQSSETLAGRIIYQELRPLSVSEIKIPGNDPLLKPLWVRGGFPRSYLADDESLSYTWRKSFIRTFLERDISNLGFNYPPQTMERLWRMISHLQGQVLNLSKLGNSLGVSHTMVRKYLDVLQQTFMVRLLEPWSGNLRKRLVRSPKIYIRDTGILHALQSISDFDGLLGNPVSGPSWETLIIENIIEQVDDFNISYFRSAAGAEVDLILEKGNRRYAIEIKLSSAPKVSVPFFNTLNELDVEMGWIVAPVDEPYPLRDNVWVYPPVGVLKELQAMKSRE